MVQKTFRLLKDILLVIASSGLLVLSFPTFDFGILAWVGLLPLLLAIHNRKPWIGFLLSLICGMLFFIGVFNWILEISKYTLLHHGILAVYLGSYFGFFGFAFCFINKKCGTTPAFLAAPFLWVCLEYIRSNLFFMALPWALLSHSQYQCPLTMQIASITGAYGVSFMIVMINSALALSILAVTNRPERHKSTASHLPSRRGMILTLLPATALMAFALFYGRSTLSKPINGEEIKISVIQGNIEQKKKWDKKYAGFIMETYAQMTRKAAKDKPELIIWPETATPRAINLDRRIYGQVKHIAMESDVDLLIGSAHQQKFEDKGSRKLAYVNSAFLIHPGTGISKNQQYNKIRLLPFGEYLPMKGTLPWSLIDVPNRGRYRPGKEFTIFKLPDFKFGVTICWENIFPDLVRQFVKSGAQFIVNMTNEAWFGKTAAPYQFLSMSVFRAVENRVFVIRCANTGISCFIDPYGRIVDRLKDKNGRDIFVRGVLNGSVIPLKSDTFYTRYGDWWVWLCISFSIVFIIFALFKKGKR